MKSEKELIEKLNELKSDVRLTYKAATVFSNAPLALIQLGLETEIHTIEKCLEFPLSKFPLPKIQVAIPLPKEPDVKETEDELWSEVAQLLKESWTLDKFKEKLKSQFSITRKQ